MTNRSVLKLSFAKKGVLATAGIAALAVPIVVGIIYAPSLGAQQPVASTPPLSISYVASI